MQDNVKKLVVKCICQADEYRSSLCFVGSTKTKLTVVPLKLFVYVKISFLAELFQQLCFLNGSEI